MSQINEKQTTFLFDTKDDILCHFPVDDLPIVSVGCGMCQREHEIRETRTVICVDPTTAKVDAWNSNKKVMTPDFEYIKNLIKAKPSIIGNCHLLIEYPFTDYVTYDILAIYDLQPKSLVLVTTLSPKSGGLLLHMWLNNNGIRTWNKKTTIDNLKEKNLALESDFMKYELTLKKKLNLGKNRDGTWNKDDFVIISGKPKCDTIIKRPLLSPNYMENMGLKNKSAEKSFFLIQMIKKMSA